MFRCLAKSFRPACIPTFAKSYRWQKSVYFNHVPRFQPVCFWRFLPWSCYILIAGKHLLLLAVHVSRMRAWTYCLTCVQDGQKERWTNFFWKDWLSWLLSAGHKSKTDIIQGKVKDSTRQNDYWTPSPSGHCHQFFLRTVFQGNLYKHRCSKDSVPIVPHEGGSFTTGSLL